MKFYIDFHTGAGNEWVEGTLEDAMRIADEGAAYTQCDITIYSEGFDEYPETDGFSEDAECAWASDHVVAERRWWGVQYASEDGDDENDIIDFGRFGYYGAWYKP